MLNACDNIVHAFINEVAAQSGKAIPEDIADRLIHAAHEGVEHIAETRAMSKGGDFFYCI